MTTFWDFSIRQTRIAFWRTYRQTRIAFWRTYGSDWQSLDRSSIQKRRAGSRSGGLPKRTGNEEQKTNPRRSISWVLHISVQRTGSGDLPCDARRSASAWGQAATDQAGAPHAHARSRASNWRMAQIGRAGLLQLPRSTRKPRKPRGVPEPHAWALVADPPAPEPEASTRLDTHANAGPAMASSTACAPSISR